MRIAEANIGKRQILVQRRGGSVAAFYTKADGDRICVLDLHGRLVLTMRMDARTPRVDLSALPKGLFVVRVQGSTKQQTTVHTISNP